MISHTLELVLVIAAALWFANFLWSTYKEAHPVCPGCRRTPLRKVNFARGTMIVDGHTVPDSWTCLECDGCHSRFRHHAGGRWETVNAGEGADDFEVET